ncbi:MAG: hotdog domain-containing protein [Candidatus Sericytochromatia bacterium]|nr:hotdog domain-containing protein [Candidatus Sericytochromatia bacterium]
MRDALEHLVGRVGTADAQVSDACTAVSQGSGALPLLATSQLVALAEQAAVQALAGVLPLGMTTVTTRVNLQHRVATPLGHHVQVRATLVAAEGRRLCFAITVDDERDRVAEGEVERFMLEAERLMARLADKRPKT